MIRCFLSVGQDATPGINFVLAGEARGTFVRP